MRIAFVSLCILFMLKPSISHTQCIKSKYLWTIWKPISTADSVAKGNIDVNGQNIGVTMKSNFTFITTSTIFGFKKYGGFKDTIPNSTVPATTWSNTQNGTTTMCFSQTVTNPVLLLASLGSKNTYTTLSFSIPYSVVYDGGGMTYNNGDSITGNEGYAIIKFKGTFQCVTIYSKTPEYYTNITWGLEPSPDDSFINTNKTPTICFRDSVILSTNSGLGRTFQWTLDNHKISGANNAVFVAKDSGIYRVFTTFKNGCIDSSLKLKVTVNPLPKVTVGANQTICQGSNTTIGSSPVSGISYFWSSKPPGFSSMKSEEIVTPASTTTYYLTETYSSTGCKKSDSVIITVNSLTSSNVGKDTEICLGMSAKIGANPVNGSTYQWSSKPLGFSSTLANPNVSPILTTMYYLTEIANCNGTKYKKFDSVIVTVNPLPNAIAGNDTNICQGENAIIGIASLIGHSYSWTSVPSGFISTLATLSVEPSLTTSYNLTETILSTGCQNQNSVKVSVYPLPIIPHISNKYICLDEQDKITLFAPRLYKNIWLPSGDTGKVITIIDTGIYILIAIDSNNCKNYDTFNLINRCVPSLFLPTSFTPNGDGLNETFKPILDNITNFDIHIYNRWGELLYETNDYRQGWDGTFRGQNCPLGCYLYMVTYSGFLKSGIEVESHKTGVVTILR